MPEPRFQPPEPMTKSRTATAATAKKRSRKKREVFGTVRTRGTRTEAHYVGPDGKRHRAPMTFSTVTEARGWLAQQRAAMLNGSWTSLTPEHVGAAPKRGGETLGAYAERWIRTRTNSKGVPLSVRTTAEYRRLMRTVLADLAARPMNLLRAEEIREWYYELADRTRTQAARAYQLLAGILKTAHDDGLIPHRIWYIRGAASASSNLEIVIPTDEDIPALMEAIDPRFRAAIVIGAWAQQRFGEMTELRRKDIEVLNDDNGQTALVAINITRAVVHTAEEGFKVQGTKWESGSRSVLVPPHVHHVIVEHLRDYVDDDPEALLFPSLTDRRRHLAYSVFNDFWYAARDAIGKPELHFHALRHYGATVYAQSGATLKELQKRLGHATVTAAMRYQHVVEGRDAEIVTRMSARFSADATN